MASLTWEASSADRDYRFGERVAGLTKSIGSYWRRFISQDLQNFQDEQDLILSNPANLVNPVKPTMKRITRRSFLKSTSVALFVGTVFDKLSAQAITEPTTSQPLSGWEYRRGSLGRPWEAWLKANDDGNVWTQVSVPHCFNALDSVDPDVPYYQGPGWYRTKIGIANPFPGGRTLLQFEGAGQKTEVFVHTEKIAS